ncbi:Transposase [Marinobacter litoralis]|uniref:Transposase n=1 Tax=Marinobacter litoralis TaxID=187981 RepID=A0A3M2RKS1_9GAMM|nr:site-specific integrase [Marinobacter litoralis]RMJ05769.1 Transposase [Marinobacter litoralis]
MGEVTKASILAARTKMAKRKGRGASGLMAPKTINSHMTILRMIMTEAAERICKYVREDYRIYYQLRFYTGVRTGEIDGLKWEHVDFERQEILVRETLINGETEYTKTDGSQREIPMFGPVYDALKTQYEATGKLSKFVFCNREGKPLDHNSVTKRVWYPLLELLKLQKRRPYQTRHTAATLLLASGENPEWVARVLGHSSTAMLFKVYSRYIPNVTRMDGSAFERLIRNRVTTKEEVCHEVE